MRVKKPAELTKEQWAKYREGLKLSLHAIDKSLDLIADMNFQAGEIVERKRIIKLLENPYWHSIQSPDIHIDCEMCKTIKLIKGEQK
jgi:hypothetical protein